MKPLEYRFSLDMNDEAAQVFCNVRNGDNCSKIIASLRNDGKAYSIEGTNLSVVFAALKPDGNTLYENCTVSNNTIIYDFNDQTAPVSGSMPCQFILIDGDSENATRLSTPVFYLEIENNVDIDEEHIVSSETFTALTEKIAEAQELINRVEHDLETGAFNGFSPIATVTKLGHTATITITDKNGTTTVPIYDGDAGEVSNKMDLAPLNPTAAQIAALSNGQLYGDTVNHKGTIKDGQSFYDTVYIDENYRKTYTSPYNPPIFVPRDYHETGEDSIFKKGDRWVNKSWGAGFGVYVLNTITAYANPDRFVYDWRREYETWYRNTNGDGAVPSVQIIYEVQYQQGVRGWYETPNFLEGVVLYEASAELGGTIQKVYKCYATRVNGYQLLTYWAEISVPENYYTKTEINAMIGDIETALSEV